ncbi:hypothetical protein HQQ81_13400 [Microbacteriaceae bacterium VKM Ac-2854]|nr:hypothetical protein [Microbacteriaceae bacterium VKM Ac-2854]
MTRRPALEDSTDVSELLGFGGRRVRLLAIFFVAANILLVVLNLDWSRLPGATVGALALLAGAVALLARAHPDPFPTLPTVLVVVAAPSITVLGWWGLRPSGWEGSFATWFLGATAFTLFALCLRGRLVSALIAHAAVVAVTLAWMPAIDHDPLFGITATMRYSILLICAVLFRIGLLHATNRMRAVRAQRQEIAAAAADAEGRFEVREQRVRFIADLAEPILARVAAGEPHSAELTRDAANVEASIRDSLRAFGLVREPLLSAVRAARLRGVDVVLLDDSDGDIAEGALDRVATTAARTLGDVGFGRVTIRLLPPGREAVATIVADLEPGVHLDVR